jgi:hypothetical protein
MLNHASSILLVYADEEVSDADEEVSGTFSSVARHPQGWILLLNKKVPDTFLRL